VLKPSQTKFYHADTDDLAEAISSAMSSIADAMDAMKGMREFEGYFNALGNLYDEMKPDCDMYDDIAAKGYEAEQEAMVREYWRSVI